MRSTLAMAAVALALMAPTASADAPGGPLGSETSTFAHAQVGSLSVVSGVLVTRGTADMRGVWNDEHVSCRTTRVLTVRIVEPTKKLLATASLLWTNPKPC